VSQRPPSSPWRWRRLLLRGALGCAAGLAVLTLFVVWQARAWLAHAPAAPADAALILGNRAYLDGALNPCLAGRVARGVELARAGLAPRLVVSGGADSEDGRNEARVMATLAREAGFAGPVLLEPQADSTRENLSLSWPLLAAAGVRRVIVVSDASHLWRVQRLAAASGFDRAFEVQYVASDWRCARTSARQWQRVLREPLAIVNNAFNGYFF